VHDTVLETTAVGDFPSAHGVTRRVGLCQPEEEESRMEFASHAPRPRYGITGTPGSEQ